MASYGAAKEAMAAMPAGKGLKVPKVGAFHHMEIHPGETGGAIAQHFHEHTSPDGYKSVREHGGPHVFGDGDGHAFSAHIEKHIGIAMPGKSMAREDEPEEGIENVGKGSED